MKSQPVWLFPQLPTEKKGYFLTDVTEILR